MPRQTTKRDPAAAEKRLAIAERRVGVDARCACGETRIETLIKKDEIVICHRCEREQKGMTVMDKHHPAGKSNSPITILVPVNDHRARLSVDQRDWPKKTLQNQDASPLLKAAACIRGFIDTAQYLIDELLAWIAEFLETLNELLIKKLGPRWWLKTEAEIR